MLIVQILFIIVARLMYSVSWYVRLFWPSLSSVSCIPFSDIPFQNHSPFMPLYRPALDGVVAIYTYSINPITRTRQKQLNMSLPTSSSPSRNASSSRAPTAPISTSVQSTQRQSSQTSTAKKPPYKPWIEPKGDAENLRFWYRHYKPSRPSRKVLFQDRQSLSGLSPTGNALPVPQRRSSALKSLGPTLVPIPSQYRLSNCGRTRLPTDCSGNATPRSQRHSSPLKSLYPTLAPITSRYRLPHCARIALSPDCLSKAEPKSELTKHKAGAMM
jgi:hypothetical protein